MGWSSSSACSIASRLAGTAELCLITCAMNGLACTVNACGLFQPHITWMLPSHAVLHAPPCSACETKLRRKLYGQNVQSHTTCMAPDASRMPTLFARTPINSIFCTGPGALVRMPACAQRPALKGQAFHAQAGSICIYITTCQP